MEILEDENVADIEPTGPTGPTDTRLCPSCKTVARPGDEYCSKCGTRIDFKPSLIYGEYARDQLRSEEDNEVRRFIDNNSDFYIEKFRIQDLTGKDVTWNWPAFLFSPLWCFYRKQYILGAIVMVSVVLLNYIAWIGDLLQFGISVYIGLMGNYFYRGYVEHHIEIASEMPVDDKKKYYQQKGGVSLLAAFGVFFGMILILYFLTEFFK